MAQRYSLCYTAAELSNYFGVSFKEAFYPKYNAATGSQMPVITQEHVGTVKLFKWGLVPAWSLDDKIAASMGNIKAEDIFQKSPFKQLVNAQRCAVFADGYFDWRNEGGVDIPYRITLFDDAPFAMAGLYDAWEMQNGEILYSFGIITRTSAGLPADISMRMPVILLRDQVASWLLAGQTQRNLNQLLANKAQPKFSYYKVNRTVNLADCDSPQCIEPAPKVYPGETLNMFE